MCVLSLTRRGQPWLGEVSLDSYRRHHVVSQLLWPKNRSFRTVACSFAVVFFLSIIFFPQTRIELLWPRIVETIFVPNLPKTRSGTKRPTICWFIANSFLGYFFLLFLSCYYVLLISAKPTRQSFNFYIWAQRMLEICSHLYCPRACPFIFTVRSLLSHEGSPFWLPPVFFNVIAFILQKRTIIKAKLDQRFI